jgi:hypothetical protein
MRILVKRKLSENFPHMNISTFTQRLLEMDQSFTSTYPSYDFIWVTQVMTYPSYDLSS